MCPWWVRIPIRYYLWSWWRRWKMRKSKKMKIQSSWNRQRNYSLWGFACGDVLFICHSKTSKQQFLWIEVRGVPNLWSWSKLLGNWALGVAMLKSVSLKKVGIHLKLVVESQLFKWSRCFQTDLAWKWCFSLKLVARLQKGRGNEPSALWVTRPKLQQPNQVGESFELHLPYQLLGLSLCDL